MSNSCIDWAFKAKTSTPAKVVLLNLADNADRYGRVSFSRADLAKECNLSTTEIMASVADLASKKLIMLDPNIKSSAITSLDNTVWHALLLINRNSGEVVHAD